MTLASFPGKKSSERREGGLWMDPSSFSIEFQQGKENGVGDLWKSVSGREMQVQKGGGEDRARLARARPLQIRICPGAFPDLTLVGGERERVAGAQWERAERCVAALAEVNWQSRQSPDKGQMPSAAGAPGVCLQGVGPCLVYCGLNWLSGPHSHPCPSAGVSPTSPVCLVASRRIELATVLLRAESTSTALTAVRSPGSASGQSAPPASSIAGDAIDGRARNCGVMNWLENSSELVLESSGAPRNLVQTRRLNNQPAKTDHSGPKISDRLQRKRAGRA